MSTSDPLDFFDTVDQTAAIPRAPRRKRQLIDRMSIYLPVLLMGLLALASSWPLPWLTLNLSPAVRISVMQGMTIRSRRGSRASRVMPPAARCGRRRSTVCAAGILRSPCSHQPAAAAGSPLSIYCRKNLRLGILGSAGMVRAWAATLLSCEPAGVLFKADVTFT